VVKIKQRYVQRVKVMLLAAEGYPLSKEMTDTVSVISQISGKSTRTLSRTLSLLKLVLKIQDACHRVLSCFRGQVSGVIAVGTLPVSQGYILAANLAAPDLFAILDEIMGTPVTNVKLEKMLTACKKTKPNSADPKSL
jgi:hypothetical protein